MLNFPTIEAKTFISRVINFVFINNRIISYYTVTVRFSYILMHNDRIVYKLMTKNYGRALKIAYGDDFYILNELFAMDKSITKELCNY